MIINFIFLFSALLLAFAAPSFTRSYFYDELENRYRNVDFSMSASHNSNTRFFSVRPLSDSSTLDGIINDYAIFFETNSLIEINGNKTYVRSFSSSLADFAKIANPFDYPNAEIGSNEVIITSSLAQLYNLTINDTISLFGGEGVKDVIVVRIIQDGGLFEHNAIYLNKEASLSFFFPRLPSFIFPNLANKIYFSVVDNISISDAMDAVASIDGFSNLEFDKAIDEIAVNQLIDRNIAVFNLIISIILVALLIVLQTTFALYFEDKKKIFAINSILGGRSKFSYGVIAIELLLFFLISFIFSIYLVNTVFAVGLASIISFSSYTLSLSIIAYSFAVTFLLGVFTSVYYFLSFNRRSPIEQSKDIGVEKKIKILPISIFLITSIISYLVLKINFFHQVTNEITPVIQSALIFIVLFCSSFLLIYYTPKILKGIKSNSSLYLYLKILLSKTSFYHFITVFILCSMSIFLLFLVDDHMTERTNILRNEITADFALTNFTSGYDDIYSEISQLSDVKHVARVGLYKGVSFSDISQSLETIVSIDHNVIHNFFSLSFDTASLDSLARTDNPIILLPIRYHYLFDLEIGETINLDLNPEFTNIEFEIGGFFQKEFSNIAFINIGVLPEFNDISHNSILVVASENTHTLKNNLISEYSENLIYVIDFNELISKRIISLERAEDLVMIILVAVLICFSFAIFNHSLLLLGQMKSTHARLVILGYSKKKMAITLVLQNIIVLLIILFVTAVAFVLFSSQLEPLIILWGEYENIDFIPSSLIKGLLLTSFVYIITTFIYILGVLQINPSTITKTY